MGQNGPARPLPLNGLEQAHVGDGDGCLVGESARRPISASLNGLPRSATHRAHRSAPSSSSSGIPSTAEIRLPLWASEEVYSGSASTSTIWTGRPSRRARPMTEPRPALNSRWCSISRKRSETPGVKAIRPERVLSRTKTVIGAGQPSGAVDDRLQDTARDRTGTGRSRREPARRRTRARAPAGLTQHVGQPDRPRAACSAKVAIS